MENLVKRIAHTLNHPVQYILPDNTILGVFYDSYSKQHHLAHYVPYNDHPIESICKKAINFSSSGSEDKPCPICYAFLAKFNLEKVDQ